MIDASWYEKPAGIREREGAGGVVVRRQGRDALIALVREGQFADYVLPKGGVDPGETPLQAARREIAEEAGLDQLKQVADLGVRSRLAFSKRRWINVHYFLFVTEQIHGLPSDHDRHPHPPAWFRIDALPEMFWPEQRTLILEHRAAIVQAVGL